MQMIGDTNLQNVNIAVLSDIHGNRWALEAVLADIRQREIDQLVNLGDSLYGPLDPAGTAEILLSLDIPTVRGNEDRIIIQPAHDREDSPTLRCVRGQLSPDRIHWLESLELTTRGHTHFLAFHGTPQRDDEYLLEEVTGAGVRLRNPLELMQRLPPTEQPLILCGHSHVPGAVHLPDGRLLEAYDLSFLRGEHQLVLPAGDLHVYDLISLFQAGRDYAAATDVAVL